MAEEKTQVTEEKTVEEKPQQEKTFTQDAVNNIVQERLAKEKKKYSETLSVFEDFGGLEGAVDLLKDVQAKKEAEKTELEKAKEKLDSLNAELEKAQQANKSYQLKERNKPIIDKVFFDIFEGMEAPPLPDVYRDKISLVEDEAEQTENIRSVIAQFKSDVEPFLGSKTSKDFGKPTKQTKAEEAPKRPLTKDQLKVQYDKIRQSLKGLK